MTTITETHFVNDLLEAVIEASDYELRYAAPLPVTEADRELATRCAEKHEYANRRFAHNKEFYRGKKHFDTIIRGYLGEIVVRKALGLPHQVDDLVFDRPQKRPDLLSFHGHNFRLDMKCTEDGTARINQQSHHNDAKRPFCYIIAAIAGPVAHIWCADADSVDKWDVKSFPSPHYWRKLPEAPSAE